MFPGRDRHQNCNWIDASVVARRSKQRCPTIMSHRAGAIHLGRVSDPAFQDFHGKIEDRQAAAWREACCARWHSRQCCRGSLQVGSSSWSWRRSRRRFRRVTSSRCSAVAGRSRRRSCRQRRPRCRTTPPSSSAPAVFRAGRIRVLSGVPSVPCSRSAISSATATVVAIGGVDARHQGKRRPHRQFFAFRPLPARFTTLTTACECRCAHPPHVLPFAC